MTKNYELMVVITTKLSEEEASGLNETILSWVKEQGGEIIKTDPWGRRMLAYPINKQTEAYYFLNFLKLETIAVKNVKRQINLNEKVIRHMFIARND